MAFDPSVSREADLRVWREQFADSVPIDQLRPRQPGTVVGVVEKIRLEPGRQLAVTVSDGHGRLTASFTGRSNLPGLELGAALRMSGTVAQTDQGTQMRNPHWALVAEPYG